MVGCLTSQEHASVSQGRRRNREADPTCPLRRQEGPQKTTQVIRPTENNTSHQAHRKQYKSSDPQKTIQVIRPTENNTSHQTHRKQYKSSGRNGTVLCCLSCCQADSHLSDTPPCWSSGKTSDCRQGGGSGVCLLVGCLFNVPATC